MNNYKTPTLRGANMVDAQPQRLTSADGSRWACGRNQKCSIGGGRFGVVECWTLKRRDGNGKVVVEATHRDRAEAERWVK